MKDLAIVAVPLTKELKARQPDTHKIVWTDEMKQALDTLKQDLMDNVILQLPDPTKTYVLEVNSSDYSVGGVLSQHNDKEELRPVSLFSRKLQGEKGKDRLDGVSGRRRLTR